ncbi:MAG: septum formation initiator family protein [Patescibacteria group bacterium]
MPRSWITLLSSRWLTIGLLVFIIFVGVSVGREYARQASLQRQIDALQADISSVEQKNQDLTGVISYLDTQKFTEEEARTNLGLQKPGEQVIVIQRPEDGNSSARTTMVTAANWQKWWWYFFAPNKLQPMSTTDPNHLPTT